MLLGESSQTPDVAACANIRFGSVGPAMALCQWSHRTNSFASWLSTGTYFGAYSMAGGIGATVGNTTTGVAFDVGSSIGFIGLPWAIMVVTGLVSALGLLALDRSYPAQKAGSLTATTPHRDMYR